MNTIFIFILLSIVCPLYCLSPDGDVVGKLAVGYQGWFACKGDGSPYKNWNHWGGNPPSKTHLSFENWPDTREYTKTYQTGFANLGNGKPAKLFSSYDEQTVDTHLKWMSDYGIDVAAVQRFHGSVGTGGSAGHNNHVTDNVMKAAEKHKRKFYIMWDISGWTSYHADLKTDWDSHVSKWAKSPAYAHQNGKPVVCIWGFGVPNRPNDPQQMIDMINWLKGKGAYVIGGVGTQFRKDTAQHQKVYLTFNMIQPWQVGGLNTVAGAKAHVTDLKADFEFLKTHNVDYQPVLFPGFAWSNWKTGKPNQIPRVHGDFLWQQFVNVREVGVPSAYIAMFDEYDEGTAIAKTAEDKSMIPTDHYFYTLDADGVKLSSDFYLRLAGDGARMMKKQIPLTQQHPTKHTK